MNRQLFNAMVAQYGTKTVMDTNQVLEWSGGAHCYLPSLKFYGECKQYGTPTPDNPAHIEGFTGPCMVHNGPYFSTPHLYGVGEYKDEWDYVTGKGIRNVAKATFTGSESWRAYGSNTGANGYYTYRWPLNNAVNKTNTGKYMCLCTHYKQHNSHAELYYGQIEAAYVGGINDASGWIVIGTTQPTVSEFKSFLAEQYANGTPITVYYALAEPIPFEERPDYQTYIPIPNESGKADIIDSGMYTPFEVSYVVHSGKNVGNLLNLAKREVVNFGSGANTEVRSFTGNGIIVGVSFNNYYYSANILQFEQYNNGFEFSRNNQSAYGIGFDLRVSPNTNYVCSFDELESRSDNVVQLAEYDGNGNWLRSVNPKSSSLTGKSRLIQTSADAVWGVFVFRNPDMQNIYRYSNVSIRKE